MNRPRGLKLARCVLTNLTHLSRSLLFLGLACTKKIQLLDQEYCCILRRHTASQPFPSGFRLNCKFVGFLLASGSIEISQSVYFESRIWRHFRLLDSKPFPKRLERASLMTDSKRSKNTLRTNRLPVLWLKNGLDWWVSPIRGFKNSNFFKLL